jgi:hypothetical protein
MMQMLSGSESPKYRREIALKIANIDSLRLEIPALPANIEVTARPCCRASDFGGTHA